MKRVTPLVPKWWATEPRKSDAWLPTAVGFVLRLGVVIWASSRFPPTDDARFYHVLATRLSQGLGYTWAWPDGAVTYAAHYPVGYPAMIAALYRVFGDHPGLAMTWNALLGAASVFAVHRISATRASRGGAIVAAFAVALHPGLVLYTPALMTEGVTGVLLVLAAWIVCIAERDGEVRGRRLVALGICLGVATLVRPQSLLAAPFFGALLPREARARTRAFSALVVTALAVAVCLPWTARNCRRMEACVLVSANAGWNLFIGAAPGATGSWVSLDELGVPAECRTVWGEAQKDACFQRAGARAIRKDPLRWMALMPAKLGTTFDYAGAAGWYLHASNPAAFGERSKVALGVVETLWQRLVMLAALAAVSRIPGARRRSRGVLALLSAVALCTRAGWVAHAGLVAGIALLGTRVPRWPAAATSAAVVFTTLVAHAVFFGAGRYSLVCFPLLSALAGTVLTPAREPRDTAGSL